MDMVSNPVQDIDPIVLGSPEQVIFRKEYG